MLFSMYDIVEAPNSWPFDYAYLGNHIKPFLFFKHFAIAFFEGIFLIMEIINIPAIASWSNKNNPDQLYHYEILSLSLWE